MKRFGFDDVAVPANLSLALGAGGVAPLDLAAGYAVFANGGSKVTPYFIDRVPRDAGRNVLYAAQPLVCSECNTPPETEVPSSRRLRSSSAKPPTSIRLSARLRA